MKARLQSLVLAIVPAALAVGQPPVNPNNPGAPPQGQFGGPQQGQFRGPGPQGFQGPPPNAMFSAIDVDGDGVITKQELRRAIVQLKKLDADKDGNITLAEVSPFGGMGPGGDPTQFFANVMQNDKNNDGKLTADEIPDNMKPMMKDADLNNDSMVTREELNTLLQNMQNRFPGGPGAGPWNFPPGGVRGRSALGNRDGEDKQITGRLMRNDQNGDGKLSADELPQNMRGMFQKGDDLNGDGAIDAGELQAVIARMGDRARALRGGVDPERNGERGRGENGRGRNRARDEN